MLKNDKWITEKATQGMIRPFQSSLIRQVDDFDGERRVLSYGLSSYGYDIRLSPADFRVFRHIPGTVIDPKRFNPDNLESAPLMVDSDGSYFILPAHSYALGVALEHLEIPENITVICIGKSTYARCFTGSTRVKLVDGDYTFLELIERVKQGDRLFGFGVLDGNIVVQELTAPRYIENASIIRITLDSGEAIDCTPDHRFMLRDGSMVEAQELQAGQSLRPIYEHESHGYPVIYDSVRADTSLSYNHKVVSVEHLDRVEPTYCLTAPETGNFALSAGVFVSNCGIVANLTPAEAAWRGHLTLEFSNSSAADCRLYAGEGIVQLLFFEGDPCDVSYDDRRGKYQDQGHQVTIARV